MDLPLFEEDRGADGMFEVALDAAARIDSLGVHRCDA
jgi:hypothetical protein